MLMDFVAIDFETATRDNASACSIGLCVVEKNVIVEKIEFYIQPPLNKYDKRNIAIHGINPEDTEDAERFDQVWDQIQYYFDGRYLVVAHNAQFDMSVLFCSLARYEISIPMFEYADTMYLCKSLLGFSDNLSLKYLAEYLEIPISDHHNALNDATVCAEILLHSMKATRNTVIHKHRKQFSELRPNKIFLGGRPTTHDFSKYRISVTQPSLSSIIPSSLSGKSFVITGDFEAYDRSDLAQRFINHGALYKSSVSKRTDYLVIGKQDPSIVGSDGKSGKERKALELIAQGVPITLVYDSDIENLLTNSKEKVGVIVGSD